MAVTVLTTDMAGGVNYTHTTEIPLDWTLIPNDTYFYDLQDKIVYYKDGSGTIINAYEPGGTGSVTSIIAGTGLDGGTITTTGTIDLANTAITPGSYTNANITVDQQGRITLASDGPAPGIGDLISTNNLSDVANAGTSLTNLGGEPSFIKNTGFNKDFGVIAGTVLEGDKNADIVLNTAKVGITPTQALDITTNNAKVGITPAQASDITTNNAKVTNATHTGDVIGSTTLTIAAGAVDIAMLSATGTADATTFLSGNNTWATPAGGGGGVFTPTINSNTMVEVSQESDFGTLGGPGGNTRTLAANTTYFIRGEVTCTKLLAITNSGTSIRGWDRETARLSYVGVAGLGDFITITDVSAELIGVEFKSTNSTAMDVVLRAANFDYTQTVPGTYDSFNAGRLKVLTIINCQFRNCFDVQHIEGFDLVDIQNCLYWYIEATAMGCHFKNVSKLQISSCEYVRWFDETSIPTPSGYATVPMIELRANGVNGPGFGGVNITGCIIHPQQTQNGLRLQPGSTTGFGTITGNTFVNIGLTTGAVASIDYDIQNTFIIQANQGLQNGNAKGVLSLSDNIIELDTSNATPVGGLYSLPITDASFIGGTGPTNPITFPLAQRVITSSANGSFTYDSKIDGNFNVNLNTTVGVNSNGTFDIQVQFRQNGAPLPLVGKATIRNSNNTYIGQPIGLSIQGTATQGDVFDVLVSVASADNVLVSELIVNGFQF